MVFDEQHARPGEALAHLLAHVTGTVRRPRQQRRAGLDAARLQHAVVEARRRDRLLQHRRHRQAFARAQRVLATEGGDEQDARPRLRMALDDVTRAGHAVHARHLPVEQDPGVGGGLAGQPLERRGAMAHAVDLDAERFEHAAEHLACGGVVVDQQRALPL